MALRDWRVWATRPEAQNTAWCERLAALGVEPLALPLLEILPLRDPDSLQQIRSLVLDFDQFDAVIFVSQNAVEHGFEWLHDYWPQLPLGVRYYAVGEKTARAIQEQGVTAADTTRAMTSEALLALPGLQSVWGQKILICRGKGGLPKLGECLHQRGAMVRYLELYERHKPHQLAERLRDLLPALSPRDLLVAFSGETLQNLFSLLTDLGWCGFANPVLVPGKRVEELAYSLGFQRLICATDASEASMLNALASFCHSHQPPHQEQP